METALPIRSVSRSIAVLQSINRHGSLSAMEIARIEGLPYPTAYRIVQTLVHEGLIELEPTRKNYRPTALVQSLAHGYRAEGRLVDSAATIIRKLTQEVGWPVFIAERVGMRMVVRDATHAETSLTFGLCHPGFHVPLLTSATGHAWLSTLGEAKLDRIVQWGGLTNEQKLGDGAIVELKRQLALVEAQGHAARVCQNGEANRSASIAVPILVDGQIRAVLTLVYFQASMKEHVAVERYLAPLQQSARMIADALEDEEAGVFGFPAMPPKKSKSPQPACA